MAFGNQSRILSLPIYPEISEAMISFVHDQIAEFFAGSGITANPPLGSTPARAAV